MHTPSGVPGYAIHSSRIASYRSVLVWLLYVCASADVHGLLLGLRIMNESIDCER